MVSSDRTTQSKMAATLYLEDGTTYEGIQFGAKVSVSGEVGGYFGQFISKMRGWRFWATTKLSDYVARVVTVDWLS